MCLRFTTRQTICTSLFPTTTKKLRCLHPFAGMFAFLFWPSSRRTYGDLILGLWCQTNKVLWNNGNAPEPGSRLQQRRELNTMKQWMFEKDTSKNGITITKLNQTPSGWMRHFVCTEAGHGINSCVNMLRIQREREQELPSNSLHIRTRTPPLLVTFHVVPYSLSTSLSAPLADKQK